MTETPSTDNEKGFVPTQRDTHILIALNRFGALKSGQIRRLIFGEKDIQVCRKRLKRLFDEEYITIIESPEKLSNGERVYFLSGEGQRFLRENLTDHTVNIHKNPLHLSSEALLHFQEINDFHITVTGAIKGHDLIELKDLTSKYEIHSNSKKLKGNERLKLCEEFHYRKQHTPFVFFPDGRIIFGRKDNIGKQRLFFTEIDQNTPFRVVREKVIAYSLFHQKHKEELEKYNDHFTVLWQCRSEKRAKALRRELVKTEGTDYILITHKTLVNENVFTARIWTDSQMGKQSILKSS